MKSSRFGKHKGGLKHPFFVRKLFSEKFPGDLPVEDFEIRKTQRGGLKQLFFVRKQISDKFLEDSPLKISRLEKHNGEV